MAQANSFEEDLAPLGELREAKFDCQAQIHGNKGKFYVKLLILV